MNQKGGVGKTLISGLLAEYLALCEHKRVLLVDLDMQCNSTDQWIGMEVFSEEIGGQLPPRHPAYVPGMDVNERSSIADIFYGKAVLPYESWLTENIGHGGFVDVMCGHPRLLEEINTAFAKSVTHLDSKVHNRLREFLALDDVQQSYDFIILDTGPSRTPIFRAAIRAASHLIIPFTPEEKDMQGITAMLQILRHENYARPGDDEKLNLIGLLPNKVRTSTNLHMTNLNSFLQLHRDITFPRDGWLNLLTAFPERDKKGSRPKSVFELSEKSVARVMAYRMASFVYENITKTWQPKKELLCQSL